MEAAARGSGRTSTERELPDVREQFAATREILFALGRSGVDPDSVLDTIVARAAALCGADVAQLSLVRGDRFEVSRISGPAPREFVEYVRDHPPVVSRSSLLGRVALDRRTQQIPDVLADPAYGRLDLQRLAGYRTLVAAPLIGGDDVVGVLLLWRKEVDPFDERTAEVMEAFAAEAAIALAGPAAAHPAGLAAAGRGAARPRRGGRGGVPGRRGTVPSSGPDPDDARGAAGRTGPRGVQRARAMG